ncbi:potassium transporter Kup [Methylocystis bryophila]|uniref:Probable potassium transport system protein Kup n=1 Tax=Methylocystis bryophila TaxID=655015 RepID=A0A1W6MZ91_9HYPH|nr:potassium transporter Kup [Methylocystis bryophila]ARN82856.1 potassium transporter Kup [Methylocystis bryophila]BDV39118.1 putative potassium transport system protein kup 3 [Methylocystis bryophila]
MTDTRDAGAYPRKGLGALALGALGVVFGDIGTSPLYTIKTAIDWAGGEVSPEDALGILSLIVWTLVIITSIKYVAIIMRADNDGEGGILALMSLLGVKHGRRPLIIAIGMLGAALLFGDGAITPAISVLSALEGLKTPAPAIAAYIVPLSVVVLVGLFTLQSKGTATISRLFGPVMTLWFVVIGGLGVLGVIKHPSVLWALDPGVGLAYLTGKGLSGFLVLGAVFLCATGAEALYADMGHFGRNPIRAAWFSLVFPALLLNYAGQTALIVDAPLAFGANPFFDLCPEQLQLALVGLATLATIIASQSIITGAFSMTRQAIQLGLLPRIRISQTSAESYGQIYVGFVNWALMTLTLILTVAFQSSDKLAAAFGIAVSLTMLLTSALMFVAMREVWRWSLPISLIVAGLFVTVDGAYVAANMVKFFEGGWIPLVVATILFFLMSCWNEGYAAIRAALERGTIPLTDCIRQFRDRERVPGTAVYLCGRRDVAPVPLLHNLKHNKVLHERVVFLQVATEHVPRVEPERRIQSEVLDDGFYTLLVHYGFMEGPDVPRALLWECYGCPIEFNEEDTSFFSGRFTLVTKTTSRWRRFRFEVFRLLHRNALPATEFFKIPPGRVVELGGQVEI